MIFISIFIIYPLVKTFLLSFFTPEGEFGLKNYIDVLTSEEIINLKGFPSFPPLGALVHNLIWIAIFIPGILLLGLGFALLSIRLKGGRIASAIIFIGMIFPMAIGGILTLVTFSSEMGLVNSFFDFLGTNH